jgi:protein SCO1/2
VPPARCQGILTGRKKTRHGDVEHTFLTSLVDQEGTLRVQCMGVRFNPDEMLRDLLSLLQEETLR